jgi:spore maturation protein CgeB
MPALIGKLKNFPLAAATNARIKAWLVERDAAATRDRYASGLPAPADDPFGPALQTQLAARIDLRRRHLGWPKPPGELHLFLAFTLYNWEAVLPEALRQFGEVTAFECRSHGFAESAPDWLERRDAMNREMLAAFVSANQRRPVDVVVGYLSGHNIDPAILTEMASLGAVVTNFCFDDKIRWPGAITGGRYRSTAAIASAVDLNLSSDPAAAPRYAAHGGLSMFHPEAAHPNWYKPLQIPFKYEVSFIGARYGWRPTLIRGLERRGIKVECFGKGWPNGPIPNEEMNTLYSQSRVNLGCGGIGFSKNLLCLKGRDFEVPMSGALYLTQNNPELSLVFETGREILTYDDIDDCARIIRTVLSDEARAAEIREAARFRSLKEHTYEARWTRVLRTLGALPRH